MKNKFHHFGFSDWAYLAIMTALIIAGTGFSKFHITGPLYLHDLALVITVLISVFINKTRISFLPIILIIIISLIYLIHSMIVTSVPFEITIRQYSIFGYLLLFFLLFNNTIDSKASEKHKYSLIIIGIISLVTQTIYVAITLFFNPTFNIFEGYNYFSSAVIFGLIIATSHTLVFNKFITIKLASIILIIFLSLTTGHSSAFLSVFIVLVTYLLFLVTPKSRLIIIILALFSITAMALVLPQFQDANANWRLMLWSYVLQDSFINNWGVLGNGFGVPYVSDEFAFKLYKELGSTGFFDPAKPDEVYLSAMHNSFITMIFSIGFLPILVILIPLIKLIQYLSTNKDRRTPTKDFLSLCLIGSTVWVSFNVILELPHSAGLYWFIYFSGWYALGQNHNTYVNSVQRDY